MVTPINLPYTYDALEPFYDAETLKIHYDILYKGYVNNLNKTEEELAKARQSRDYSNIKCLEKNLSYNGSGVVLHELFFTNMIAPGKGGEISQEVFTQIMNDFGNFNSFKEQFTAASTNIEGSRLGITCMGTKVFWPENFAM